MRWVLSIPVERTSVKSITRERINSVSFDLCVWDLEFSTRYEMQVCEDITVTGSIGVVHEEGHSKCTATELYAW